MMWAVSLVQGSSRVISQRVWGEGGAIKEEECAGFPLEWGSVPALIEWTKRMGNPETELIG